MFEQILPLLFLLLLFAVLKWSQGKKAPKTTESTASGQSESMRKLMEALGLPTDAVPPLPVPPKQLPQPPLKQVTALPKLPLSIPKTPLLPPLKLPETVRKKATTKTEVSEEVTTANSLSIWLRQPGSLKQAMILTEVLGPPKA